MRRLRKTFLYCSLFITGFFSVVASTPAWSLNQWSNEQGEGDVRAAVRLFALASDAANDPVLFPDGDRQGGAAIARLIAEGRRGAMQYEFNVYQTWIPSQLTAAQGVDTPLDVERSAWLESALDGSNYIHSAIDRLNLRYRFRPGVGDVDVILGRQAINLATTFFFTPNDLFAPFSAQAFYRVYKPGVDALRVTWSPSALSQLVYLDVAGFDKDNQTATGWSRRAAASRASRLLRYTDSGDRFEWSLLGGTVRGDELAGFSLQGELWQWLGLRMEGHYRQSAGVQNNENSSLAIGLEHRFENSLNIRYEYFYQQQGATRVADYVQVVMNAPDGQGYLAQQYMAAGADYQLSPLWFGQATWLVNTIDRSGSVSVNLGYSLADEADLSLGMSASYGRPPDSGQIRSEFGAMPKSVLVEVRRYY